VSSIFDCRTLAIAGGEQLHSRLSGQLSDLLGAVAIEVDGEFLVLTTRQLDRPFLTHGLAIAGHLNDDFVIVPNLTGSQLAGCELANFAGLLRFDSGEGHFGVGGNAER